MGKCTYVNIDGQTIHCQTEDGRVTPHLVAAFREILHAVEKNPPISVSFRTGCSGCHKTIDEMDSDGEDALQHLAKHKNNPQFK